MLDRARLTLPGASPGELWHIVAADLPLDFPLPGRRKPAARWRGAPAEAGAFIGIAHPAWSQLTIEDGRAIDVAHAVEIYNHGCAVECDRGFGPQGYGLVIGTLSTPQLFLNAIAPTLFAVVLDQVGPRNGLLIGLGLGLASFVAMVWLARRYPR